MKISRGKGGSRPLTQTVIWTRPQDRWRAVGATIAFYTELFPSPLFCEVAFSDAVDRLIEEIFSEGVRPESQLSMA